MAQFFSASERLYSPLAGGPRTYTLTPTIPAGTKTAIKEIKFTATKVGWPDGLCATVSIQFPDGTDTGTVGYDGGTTPARDGSQTVGLTVNQDGDDLPTGQYTITVQVFQAITAAITGERF